MNILSIAYPLAPVGPCAVGGAEQILTDLDAALVASGACSLVIARGDSHPAGELFPIALPRSRYLDATAKRWCRLQIQRTIDQLLEARRVDLVHLHDMNFDECRLPADIPVVVTLHMPLTWYPPHAFGPPRRNWIFVCVSESQRRLCPADLPSPRLIENGVQIPAPRSKDVCRAGFAVALARICPEKNLHEALEAGTMADTPVYIGGQVFPYPEHERYFTERIAPLLGTSKPSPRHVFLGALSQQRKQELLARASCLLHPTLAPETSSLVAMEAMASGTPVIAYPSGALAEIVEDGVTGFLVDNVRDMAQAIRSVHRLSPAACRAHAGRRFSKRNMVGRYFALYEELTNHPTRRLYA
jgi:glycosyltransferase involved in cell wall biosynthesis